MTAFETSDRSVPDQPDASPAIRRPASRRERGQGMVEYALILVLIAVVVIVILTVVGGQVNNVFSNISNGLGS
jgi:pilus assembly protein Flp/PilA